MPKKIKRRDFIRNTAAAGVTLAAAQSTVSHLPTLLIQSGVKPIVIASGTATASKTVATKHVCKGRSA